MKQVDVAVGVVLRDSSALSSLNALNPSNAHTISRQFFICRRNASQHQGNKWEFPGGKVDAGESPLFALKRELKEEINIEVVSAEPLIVINFDYPDKKVCLHVFLVDKFSGEAIGAEGQESLWVDAKNLSTYTFPDANVAILDVLSKRNYI